MSKIIYKHIPDRIRRSRQPAIRKAISRSSEQHQPSQIVQDLQYRRESLFLDQSSELRQSEPATQLASLHQNRSNATSVSISSLNGLYHLIIACERQQHLEKIRIRILCVAIFRLKNSIQPSSLYHYDDVSSFIAQMIGNSGCNDPLGIIESRVRLWVGRGERYNLIAEDLGGLGVLYMLPEDGGESV